MLTRTQRRILVVLLLLLWSLLLLGCLYWTDHGVQCTPDPPFYLKNTPADCPRR